MSIFSRFRDIISSNLNSMLDGAEDPEKLVRLMIQEMEDTLIEIKASCAGAIAARKKVGRSLADAQARATGWAVQGRTRRRQRSRGPGPRGACWRNAAPAKPPRAWSGKRPG